VQPWLDENQDRTIGEEKYDIENLPNNEYEPDNPGTMLRINSIGAEENLKNSVSQSIRIIRISTILHQTFQNSGISLCNHVEKDNKISETCPFS
jgi:hypothetical protein